MARQGNRRGPEGRKMSSPEDKALGQLFDRMIPNLKRAILRDSERRPEVVSLEIMLASLGHNY
jgi:hypothetical protein